MAIGIIVNELVMNAVKYAYPDGAGPIHVELKAQGDDLVLAISDDGVGLDDAGRSALAPAWASASSRRWRPSSTRASSAIPRTRGTRIVVRFRRADPNVAKSASAAAS